MRRSPGTTVEEPVELEVARMRRRHLRGVMAIERQVYPRPWSPNLFLSEMSEMRHRAYFVAREGRDEVGTRMLYELVSEAIRMGARAVSLEVRVSNEPAQSLYRKFGFRYVGTRKG